MLITSLVDELSLNCFICKNQISQAFAVCVDIVPLFLKTTYDLQVDDVDLVVASSSIEQSGTETAICIQHIPTGIKVQSSGFYLLSFLFIYIAQCPQVLVIYHQS